METALFIPETQLSKESSRTSKVITESRGLQDCFRMLMLVLFSLLLGFLVGGVTGLGSYEYLHTHQEVVQQKNCSEIFNETIRLPGDYSKGSFSHYIVFTVQHNGTYFIFGEVHKLSEKSDTNCIDEVKLSWNDHFKEANFTNSVARFWITDAKLSENDVVQLTVNCETSEIDETKTLLRVFGVL